MNKKIEKIEKIDIAVIEFYDVCEAAAEILGITYNSSGPNNAPETDCFEVIFPTIQECSGVLYGESKVSWRGYCEPDFEITKEYILNKYPRIKSDNYDEKSQRYIPLFDILGLIKNLLPDSELIVVHDW
jgi:hypothetical protein